MGDGHSTERYARKCHQLESQFIVFRVKYNTASAAAIDRLRRLERVGDLMKVYMDSVNTNIGVSTIFNV